MGSVISYRSRLVMNWIGCRALGDTFCVLTMSDVMAQTSIGSIVPALMKIPVSSLAVLGRLKRLLQAI